MGEDRDNGDSVDENGAPRMKREINGDLVDARATAKMLIRINGHSMGKGETSRVNVWDNGHLANTRTPMIKKRDQCRFSGQMQNTAGEDGEQWSIRESERHTEDEDKGVKNSRKWRLGGEKRDIFSYGRHQWRVEGL